MATETNDVIPSNLNGNINTEILTENNDDKIENGKANAQELSELNKVEALKEPEVKIEVTEPKVENVPKPNYAKIIVEQWLEKGNLGRYLLLFILKY